MTKDDKKTTENHWSRSFVSIRRDHKITPMARLLADEIDQKSQKDGYCWASNQAFSTIFKNANGVPYSVNTISGWISELVEAGHITRIIDKKNGNARYLSTIGPAALARLVGCEISTDPITDIDDSLSPPSVIAPPLEDVDPITDIGDSSIIKTQLKREREKENPPSLSFAELLKKIPVTKSGKLLRERLIAKPFLSLEFVTWFITQAVLRFGKKVDLSETEIDDWEEQFVEFGEEIFKEAAKSILLTNDTKGNLPSIGKMVIAAKSIKVKKAKATRIPKPPEKVISLAEKLSKMERAELIEKIEKIKTFPPKMQVYLRDYEKELKSRGGNNGPAGV